MRIFRPLPRRLEEILVQHVDVKVHGHLATILMDRPKVRNALSPQLVADLSTAFSDVHQEKRVKAVILTGGGEHFCSGLDLSVMAQIAEMDASDALPEWFTTWRQLTELLEQMLRFPKPIVAAVDGAAVGAGLALVLAADLVVASKRASFAALAVRRGLVGGATAALLAFRLGGAVAARMALTGQPIDADEAHRIGLCCAPVESQQIWVAASTVAQQCTAAPREAVQATKRVLNESVGEALLSQLAAGAADSATACTTDSASEGIRSFMERREPQWP
jgi:enoyl-CoA hydratase/carnithine racemase